MVLRTFEYFKVSIQYLQESVTIKFYVFMVVTLNWYKRIASNIYLKIKTITE